MIPISTDQNYVSLVKQMEDARAFLAEKEGVNVGQVILTCGATGGIDAALSLLPTGSTIATMPYEYFVFYHLAAGRGISVIQPPTNERRNAVEEFCQFIIERTPAACYLSCPNNPLGQEYTLEDFTKIIQAMGSGLVIVDRTLLQKNRIPTSWYTSVAGTATVLLIKSFSKTHGLVRERIGYLVSSRVMPKLDIYAHAPSLVSWQRAQECLGSAYEQNALQQIEVNNAILAQWARDHQQYTWHRSLSNFGVLECLLPVERVVQTMKDRGYSILSMVDLHCSGNGVRIALTVSAEELRAFLQELSVQTDALLKG